MEWLWWLMQVLSGADGACTAHWWAGCQRSKGKQVFVCKKIFRVDVLGCGLGPNWPKFLVEEYSNDQMSPDFFFYIIVIVYFLLSQTQSLPPSY